MPTDPGTVDRLTNALQAALILAERLAADVTKVLDAGCDPPRGCGCRIGWVGARQRVRRGALIVWEELSPRLSL
jgi:hypothetical protein